MACLQGSPPLIGGGCGGSRGEGKRKEEVAEFILCHNRRKTRANDNDSDGWCTHFEERGEGEH